MVQKKNRPGAYLASLLVAIIVAGAGFSFFSEKPAPQRPSVIDMDFLLREEADTPVKAAYFVVNFFASWCAACRLELPLLMELRDTPLRLIGLYYQDDPRDSADFLEVYGNPFDSMQSADSLNITHRFGVVALPFTLVLNRCGRVLEIHETPLREEDIDRLKRLPSTLAPCIDQNTG